MRYDIRAYVYLRCFVFPFAPPPKHTRSPVNALGRRKVTPNVKHFSMGIKTEKKNKTNDEVNNNNNNGGLFVSGTP